MRSGALALVLIAAAVAIISVRGREARSAGEIGHTRVSVSTAGAQGGLASLEPAVSANGRYVAFSSDASLVPNDTNARDVFVHDRQTGTTELVDVSSAGVQANRGALYPDISGDGRFVVFSSAAANLVPGDLNMKDDVFLRDRTAGTTTRVSVGPGGVEGNGDSITPAVSSDGRFVVFTSYADNLVANDAGMDWDVFIHDTQTGATELVSQSSAGEQGNNSSGWLGAGRGRVSADGRYVVFGSFANNLTAGDGNSQDDVFLRDRQLGTTERVSLTTGGSEVDVHSVYPDVSDDGRYVVFQSGAPDLVPDDNNQSIDVFLRDRQAGATSRVSVGPGGVEASGDSQFPRISGDGSAIAFESVALTLVPGDTSITSDIFVYSVASGTLQRITIAPDGSDGDGPSTGTAINGDGSVVAYQSEAPNLVPGDSNGVSDVFAWAKLAATPPATPTRTRTPTPTATPVLAYDFGDANCDGRVTSVDAALVLQYGAGLVPVLPCLSFADVNQDGRVTSIDAALILQFVAGLLSTLPP